MATQSKTFRILASGPFACYTRPDIRAERLSYEVPTPPAMAGMMDAIWWRPGFTWIVERIGVLKPIRMINLTRNEIDRVPHTGVDMERHGTQRRTRLLTDVAYLLFAHLEGTVLGAEMQKGEAMVGRYLKKGKRFQTPFLGCREFVARVQLAEDPLPQPIPVSMPLGKMPHHYTWEGSRITAVHTFDAALEDGWVVVP
jgi:CRISPR-associated protein Cas5d